MQWKYTHLEDDTFWWRTTWGQLAQLWGAPLTKMVRAPPAVHSCWVSILFCPLLTSPQYLFHTFARGDAKNVPLHRWWHIRDSYCNITRSYSELSRHSPPVRVPQAYHLHLMNGLDWILRQRWGAEEAEGEEGRMGRVERGTRTSCSLILPCLFPRLSATIFQHKIKIDK